MIPLFHRKSNDFKNQFFMLACFRGYAECVEGAIERGVIYGVGVYEKGEIRKMPQIHEAYLMDKNV